MTYHPVRETSLPHKTTDERARAVCQIRIPRKSQGQYVEIRIQLAECSTIGAPHSNSEGTAAVTPTIESTTCETRTSALCWRSRASSISYPDGFSRAPTSSCTDKQQKAICSSDIPQNSEAKRSVRRRKARKYGKI